jgi:predicted nucleic acid-binding protein
MMIVADASVVVKVLTEEPGSASATRTISENDVVVPDFIQFEVASALSKKVRYAGLPAEQAAKALEALPLVVPDRHDTTGLIDRAFALSISIRHALYDCLYLALAEHMDCPLVTADGKFVAAVEQAGLGVRIERLA